MKHASLLIVICALVSWSAAAQSTTTVEKNAKRITITTKKTDENGQTVTETYIAEGDEPEKILEGMAVSPEIIMRVENADAVKGENGERLFLIRSAGDKVHIEGMLNENAGDSKHETERIIVIDKSEGKDKKECYKFMHAYGGHPVTWARSESKGNCAALGVYVNNGREDSRGSRIISLIENGGAQAAGMKEGDIITKIEEFDVTDFATLHLALSHFKPGDMVTVRFNREGKDQKTRTELKDWRDLPGHEWRSRSDCGPEPVVEQDKPIENLVFDQPSVLQKLELEGAIIYPNPTEGLISFAFQSAPGPLTISVTDVNGKLIYQENYDNPEGRYNREINLKDAPQGNYLISVKQGDKLFTEQISKQ